MSDRVVIEFAPNGRRVEVERGTELSDVLYADGVEFPCGGTGRCGRCRVRVLGGGVPASADDEALLDDSELAAGWRLACRATAETPLTLEVEQFEAPILLDRSPLVFTPRPGLGIAVDLGTTTLAAQLLDLTSGRVLAAATALNPQATHGADVMQRCRAALEVNGRERLTDLARAAVGSLIARLTATARLEGAAVDTVAVVGNTVMHHLFCGLDVRALAMLPFESAETGLRSFRADQLGWTVSGNPAVHFLPCIGGFVGSDALAGVLATGMHEHDELAVLVDLGTNGEIVVGNRRRLLSASAAAGPAFEAGGIAMGMRAGAGAIDRVTLSRDVLDCHVIGESRARGICGSGLIDAVAAALELGWLEPGGRLDGGLSALPLRDEVRLTQLDIRQVQLAKAAIAAAVKILVTQWGAAMADVTRLRLAGAFGNYVGVAAARRIGLFELAEERIEAAGNTALLGAKLSLFDQGGTGRALSDLRARIEHLSLAALPEFHDTFVDETRFP